jgi:poly(beta-D-mannuronate) lyase
MSGLESRYAKDDPTQSRIDPANAAKEAARGKVLWDFTMNLGRMADQYLLSNPAKPEIADCVAHQLATWARANALTQNIEQNHEVGRHQAIMLQAWSLAGFTFAYMKLGERPHDNPDDRDMKRWLRVLADSVMKEYSDRGSTWYRKRSSNHGLWAGLAVANAGIVLNEKAKLDFGLALLQEGLAVVAANGSLPEEMARGDRALLYQNFATMPIVALAAVAYANGRELTAAQQQALVRLLRFDLDTIKQARTTGGNALPKHVDKSALSWADIAVCYLKTADTALADEISTTVRTLRPLVHIYYGGNATAAFNPAALPGARPGTDHCAQRTTH